MVLAVVRESSDGRDGGMIRVQKKDGQKGERHSGEEEKDR